MKKFAIALCALSLCGSVSFAADSSSKQQKKWPEPTKEQRQKMADMHDKMASCLKSDKPMSECRDEMMKSCQDDKDGCHMMGMGMHHGHGDHDHDSSSAKSSSSSKE